MSLKSLIQSSAAKAYQSAYNSARKKDLARPNRKPVILFTSVSRSELGSNMLRVHSQLLRRGLDRDYDIRLNLSANIKDAQTVSKQLDFIKELACADIIFCDDYHPFLYFVDYPADVKVVQLWHAVGSFKTVGFARNRKDADQRKRTSRAHRGYTHVIVSAECDRPHYSEAFNLPIERIFATGIPRIDTILDEEWQTAQRARFTELLPQAAGKRVVLFAPTFRGDDVRQASYDFSKIDMPRLAQWCRETNSVALMKFHPFTQNIPQIPEELADVIIETSDIREVNDILPAADLLVTDYSSVIYEASLLDVSMVFYAYDLEEYDDGRGFFEPYEGFVPGPIVKDFDALLTALDAGGDPAAVAAFKARHFAHTDCGSTDRVIDLVLGL